MKPFVLIVEFEIKAEDYDKFHPLIAKNARQSVQLEPGCSVFDVVSSPDDLSKIILYEVYDDEDAFKAHLKPPLRMNLDSSGSLNPFRPRSNTYFAKMPYVVVSITRAPRNFDPKFAGPARGVTNTKSEACPPTRSTEKFGFTYPIEP